MPFTGADLEALAKRQGVSINALAEQIGVHRNTLNRYIASDAEVPLSVRLALAAWLYGLPPIMRGAKPPKR